MCKISNCSTANSQSFKKKLGFSSGCDISLICISLMTNDIECFLRFFCSLSNLINLFLAAVGHCCCVRTFSNCSEGLVRYLRVFILQCLGLAVGWAATWKCGPEHLYVVSSQHHGLGFFQGTRTLVLVFLTLYDLIWEVAWHHFLHLSCAVLSRSSMSASLWPPGL